MNQNNKWQALGSRLTVDGRGDKDVQEFGAVAGVDQLIRAQGVEAQGAAAGLVLSLHHHHHVEAVARKIFSLCGSNRRQRQLKPFEKLTVEQDQQESKSCCSVCVCCWGEKKPKQAEGYMTIYFDWTILNV